MSARSKVKLAERLRAFALALPEAWEDHPWGGDVIKVGKKIFVSFGHPDFKSALFLCMKLPESATLVLAEDWAKPAGYGLGKSDWVELRFEEPPTVAQHDFEAWIVESYCAVAPKKVARLAREQHGGGSQA